MPFHERECGRAVHRKRRRTVRRRRAEKNGQLIIPEPLTWGGKRPGAGRKPRGKRPGVSHQRRPDVPNPNRGALHCVIRVVEGLPTLRGKRTMRAIWFVLAGFRGREGMAVVHFSVQRNHIHLIVEADGRQALIRGMQSLSIRLAKRINAALGRKGKILADRYHVEVLDSFRRLRSAIAYVLNNARRHAYQHGGWVKEEGYLDPCSSAFYFDGWRGRRVRPPPLAVPVCAASGYALRVGWRRHGLIGVGEIPGAGR